MEPKGTLIAKYLREIVHESKWTPSSCYELRKRVDASQVVFADLLRLAKQTVSNIESGLRAVSPEQAFRYEMIDILWKTLEPETRGRKKKVTIKKGVADV